MVGGDFVRKGGPLLLDWAERTQLRGWEMDIVRVLVSPASRRRSRNASVIQLRNSVRRAYPGRRARGADPHRHASQQP